MARNVINNLGHKKLLALYRAMVTAREIDLLEESYTGRGEAFFHVSGAGHEGTSLLNEYLLPEDYLHCHYRDKALMLARGVSAEMFFLALFNKDGAHSRGRQMNAHMSAPELNMLSLTGPVGNNALQAAGVATAIKQQPEQPIVLCSVGDGMTQEGEVIEAIGHAVRDRLPILFLVQDNQFAISTLTRGKTFYDRPDGPADEFYGIPITRMDGRHPHECYDAFGDVVAQVRTGRSPRIVVFEVDRLSNHTNADDQRMYRSAEEIKRIAETGDPLIHFQAYLVDRGVTTEALERVSREVREELIPIAERAQYSPEPAAVLDAVKPLPKHLTPSHAEEYRGDAEEARARGEDTYVMLSAIREVLRSRLESDERVTLYGEDIEDPKGDVFGVTKGLTTAFPGRVRNSPLSESLILGESIGEALAGRRPVAFLQFADFLPIAYNQIFAELGSMYWRTDGGWQAPVIVMITCGGYKPGLGPFHASSLEAIAAHTPGVDIVMPSTAGDAAGLLNAAFESGRPTLFFYPKSCLNERDNATSTDVHKQLVPLGKARRVLEGDDITMVAYGNTVGLCRKAAAELAKHDYTTDLIDLRSIQPWDVETICASAEHTGRLIVVHEDNHSAGVGAEVVATVAERANKPVALRRVTRADTYVPCNFENQLEVLPSYKGILNTAVELLGGEIHWKPPAAREKGVYYLEAIGSSPSDESITVVEWQIAPGDEVKSGQIVAELEADKAAVELKSSVAGTVEQLMVAQGDLVKVGTPIAKLKTAPSESAGREHLKPITRENPGTPIISGLTRATVETAPHPRPAEMRSTAGEPLIVGVTGAKGSRVVTNEEISSMCSSWSPADILKRTGIETRPWVAENEDALSLAEQATRQLLTDHQVAVDQIDVIICSTGTPIYNTPSMATLLHHRLGADRPEFLAPAYDINAACSGYLYGLQIAYDYLHSRPEHRVLLVTTEVLSPLLNTADPSTAPIFGDAATATLITGSAGGFGAAARVYRPSLAAQGEPGEILCVPGAGEGKQISMDGPAVFQEAVKYMMQMLDIACSEAGIRPADLDLMVPHQANQRIINAIRQRLRAPHETMYSNIRHNGNTSSSTIPLCLEELLGELPAGHKLGLAAFGGGFTFAGGVLEVL